MHRENSFDAVQKTPLSPGVLKEKNLRCSDYGTDVLSWDNIKQGMVFTSGSFWEVTRQVDSRHVFHLI